MVTDVQFSRRKLKERLIMRAQQSKRISELEKL